MNGNGGLRFALSTPYGTEDFDKFISELYNDPNLRKRFPNGFEVQR